MRSYWILHALKVALFVGLAFLGFGFVSMYLWNWLMPDVFGLGVITFWQAVGMIILAKLFFGFGHGCRGRWGGRWRGRWRQKLESKLENMTPEEREKFKKGFYERCGWWDPKWDKSESESESGPASTK